MRKGGASGSSGAGVLRGSSCRLTSVFLVFSRYLTAVRPALDAVRRGIRTLTATSGFSSYVYYTAGPRLASKSTVAFADHSAGGGCQSSTRLPSGSQIHANLP
jgi:hypothetical protein